MEKGGVKQRKIGEGGGEGEKMWERMERRKMEIQDREIREKIEGAKYNGYKWVREEKIPEYLEKGKKKKKWKTVVRFKLGNEIKEGLCWKKEEERKGVGSTERKKKHGDMC